MSCRCSTSRIPWTDGGRDNAERTFEPRSAPIFTTSSSIGFLYTKSCPIYASSCGKHGCLSAWFGGFGRPTSPTAGPRPAARRRHPTSGQRGLPTRIASRPFLRLQQPYAPRDSRAPTLLLRLTIPSPMRHRARAPLRAGAFMTCSRPSRRLGSPAAKAG